MKAVSSMIQRCINEIYFNEKHTLKGQFLALAAYGLASAFQDLEKTQATDLTKLKFRNNIFRNLILADLSKTGKEKEILTYLTFVNDSSINECFKVIDAKDDIDDMVDREEEANVADFVWEPGALGAEVIKETSATIQM